MAYVAEKYHNVEKLMFTVSWCMLNGQRSPGLAGKLERWLTTSEMHQDQQGTLLGGVKVIPRDTISQNISTQQEQSPPFSRDKENNEAAPIVCLGHVSSLTKMSQSHSQRQTVLTSSRRHSVVSANFVI